MPLLDHEHLVKVSPPDPKSTDENAKFFHFKLTNEYFSTHEEYFQRYISCFSEIWTCEYTGKSNLTYEHALECELEYEKHYGSFPVSFHLPTLIAVNYLPIQKSLKTLASKISYILSLFLFKKETVEFRKFAQEEKTKNVVFRVNEYQIPANSSDVSSLKGKNLIDFYNSVNYKLISENNLEKCGIMKSLRALQRTSPKYSIESIIVFLKKHMKYDSTLEKPGYVLIPKFIKKYGLNDESNILKSFPFNSSSVFYELLSLANIGSNGICSSELSGHKLNQSPNKKNNSKNSIKSSNSNVPITKFTQAKDPRKLTEDELKAETIKKARIESEKKQKEQERLKREAERLKEKALHDDYNSHYHTVRHDLLCDDLKPLVVSQPNSSDVKNGISQSYSVPVMDKIPEFEKSKLPKDCFMNSLMIVEFIHSFKELFDPIYEREFPNDIDLALLESSLISKEPDSSYGEILQSFLATAINTLSEDENILGKDDNHDSLSEVPDDSYIKNIVAESINYSLLPKKMFGTQLKNLVIDNCTISEVLRLYILSSGSKFFNLLKTNERKQRGCLMFYDDPGIEFINNNKHILKKLTRKTVFELESNEKLEILSLLMNQLLTRSIFRDHIFDSFDNYLAIRAQMRELQKKEQTLEKLNAANLQRIAQLKIEESINQNSGLSEQSSPKSPYAPFVPTRNAIHDPDELLNSMVSNPLEWTLEKSQFIKGKFDISRDSLNTACFDQMQLSRSFMFGYDRYYRIYFLSKYFKSIVVCKFDETDDVLTKLKQMYIVNQNPQITKYFKSSLGIDINNPVLINKMPITKIIEKNFSDALDVSNPDLPFIASINNYLQYETLIGLLTNRGVNERQMKYYFINKRDTFKSLSCSKNIIIKNISANTSDMENSNLQEIKTNNDEIQDNVVRDEKMEIENDNIDRNPLVINEQSNLEFEDSRDNFNSASYLEPELRSGLGLVVTDIIVGIIDIRSKLIAGRLFKEELDNEVHENEFKSWIPESILREVKINEVENTPTKHNFFNVPKKVSIDFDILLDKSKDLLIQIAFSVDPNYLIEPLGLSQNIKKNKVLNSRKNDNKVLLSEIKITKRNQYFDKWIEILKDCNTFSQLALFLVTFENSIAWSRSAINKKCHNCCRKFYQPSIHLPRFLSSKTNDELSQILLCNLCERVFHFGCLKNNTNNQFTGTDWFCMNCNPLIIEKRTVEKPSKRRKVNQVSSSEEDSNEEDVESSTSSENNRVLGINTRGKQKRMETKQNGIIDDYNSKLLNNIIEKRPTRAVMSAAMTVLKKIIDNLISRSDSTIFTVFNSTKENNPNLVQISQNLKNGDYESPSRVVDDINLLISSKRNEYASNQNQVNLIDTFQSRFLQMIDSNNLSFFLDD